MTQEKQWEEDFNEQFRSLHRWIENRGAIGTKQAIRDFISELISKDRERIMKLFADNKKRNGDFLPIYLDEIHDIVFDKEKL